MRCKENKGLDKYGPGYYGPKKSLPVINDGRPRCIDGSLDKRFKVNRGLDKYDEVYQRMKNGGF